MSLHLCVYVSLISGDFDIPSSREDVDSDSAWNQWLQQNIAPLFVSSLSTFRVSYDKKKKIKINPNLPGPF